MLTRALIVLLIVLNLGVAAWWTLRPAPRIVADHALDGVPELQLADDRKPASRVVAPVSAPAPAPATTPAFVETAKQEAPQKCFRFGPFADAASAGTAAATLRASVRKATTRSIASGGKDWTVWLPPFADNAAAQAKAQEIAGAGIKDYYVVAQGAQANAVMLGRYGSAENAQRRIAELHGKGIEAQVQAPADATSRSWVDVVVEPGFAVAAAQARIGATSVKSLDCASR